MSQAKGLLGALRRLLGEHSPQASKEGQCQVTGAPALVPEPSSLAPAQAVQPSEVPPNIVLQPTDPVWLEAASLTDVGTVRCNNEDAVRLLPDAGQGIRLAMLADGMGGHACGEVASALAIDAVMTHWRGLDDHRHTPEQWLQQLAQAVQSANTAIWEHSQARPEMTGMGTTLCVVSLAQGHAYWAWVGDSRVYLWRSGLLTQLTRDDTVVNRMLDDGILNPEQAAKHPDSHVLCQALGTHEAVERVNLCAQPLRLAPGDRLIVTSDGVHDLLAAEQWSSCLAPEAPHEAANALIEASKATGSADNLSAVVIDVRPASPPREPGATKH